jgi:hypothetical protein
VSPRLLLLTPLLLAAACQEAAAPMSLPDGPDLLVATAKTGEILLEWRDVASNERSYRVEVSRNGGPWLLLVEAVPNTVTARHANVERGVTYSYRVAACNAAGCSDFALATTQIGAPPMLTTFNAMDIGAYNATLKATAQSAGLPTRFWFVVYKAGSSVPVLTTERLAPFAASDTTAIVTVSHVLFNLEPLTNYEVSAHAENSVGEAIAVEPKAFRTSGVGPPTVGGLLVQQTGRWNATVNPNGLVTYCTFEMVRAGESFERPYLIRTDMTEPVSGDVTVEAKFWMSLERGQSYSWRVIVSNALGSATSEVHTFTW